MAITIVIEEANYASGARLAAMVAQCLEKLEPVRVLLRDPGPLEEWLAENVASRVDLCNRGNFPYAAPLAERVPLARALLQNDASDTVYVYGYGASDFAIAARNLDRRIVLQASQSPQQIEQLLARDQTKTDCGIFCDALILSGAFTREAKGRLFGRLPPNIINLGFRVDFSWLSRVTSSPPPEAVNGGGQNLDWSQQFVVGGHGSAEAATCFGSLARECPTLAFLWFGGADDGADRVFENPNVFALTDSGNLFPSLAALGAYVAWGHATDPMAALAAVALGVPLLGFATGAVTELLGHYGILCHGDPDPILGGDILRKIAQEIPTTTVLDPDWRRRQLDIEPCVDTVLDTLADVRLQGSDS